MPNEKVSIRPEIAAALERVRVGGRTNMRDAAQVVELLTADDALDAADWVESHPEEYAQGIAKGFVIEND
jgi:hypothetical protein